MKRRLFLATPLALADITLAAQALAASRWSEKPQWQSHFNDAKVNGSFLLYDLKNDRYSVFNRRRATTRYLPASTFKILNSLIALETGVVRDENEVLPWDGKDKGIPEWNRDQDMKSAIAVSAIWFYQELARRIGPERMQRYVRAARYGNQDISGGIDHFWLNGSLRISSQEQIDFLVRLHQKKLPFSRRSQEIVRRILVQDAPQSTPPNTVLRAKTGLAGVDLGLPPGSAPVGPKIGWWVGYVERPDNAYFFAINLNIAKDKDSAARQSITKAILHDQGIL